jgi:hypothetical protein
VARVSDFASSLGRPVYTGLKQMKGLAPHPWADYSAHWPVTQMDACVCGGERHQLLCVGVAYIFAEEPEPLWLAALLLGVPEAFGRYISLHSARSAYRVTNSKISR